MVGDTKNRKWGCKASKRDRQLKTKRESRCWGADMLYSWCKYNTSTALLSINESKPFPVADRLISYLLKVAHSPLCLWPSVAFCQASATRLLASSRSWTLEAWEPGGGSSWPGSGSSSRHSEKLQRNSTNNVTVYPLKTTVTAGEEPHVLKYSAVLLSLPRYSNSSFRAMPLWEKHCWQMRAYLEETTRNHKEHIQMPFPSPPQ